MRNTSPKRFALLAALITMIFAGQAVAQTPPAPQPDPLPFAVAATACVYSAMGAPESWVNALHRAQIWSVLYGYSLATPFARTPTSQPATCAAHMNTLEAKLMQAEAQVFAPGWRSARKDRTSQNAAALLKLDPAYAAPWCLSVFKEVSKTKGEQLSDGVVLDMDDWELTSKLTPQLAQAVSMRAQNDYESVYFSATLVWETVSSVVQKAKLNVKAGDQVAAVNLVKKLKLEIEYAACQEAIRLNY